MRSYASLLRPAPELPEGVTTRLSYTEPTEKNGRRGALLEAEVLKKIEQTRFVGTLLVRRLTDEKIDPRFAKNFVRQIWGIGGEHFNVQVRRSGVFLIQFRRPEDYITVREAGDTWMKGVYTIVKNRTEGCAIERERITSLPIWIGLPDFPVHIRSPEVFSAIDSVLGKPLKIDAFTAKGPNSSGAKILVRMEVAGSFPSEVPIFMYGEDGSETEDACSVIYIKPPPVCGRCVSFGHTAERCRFVDDFPAEKVAATFTGETNAAGKTNQRGSRNKDGEEMPGGSDVAEREKVIGTDGRNLNDVDATPNETLTTEMHVVEELESGTVTHDVDMQEATQEDHELADKEVIRGDDMAQQEAIIGTGGFHLNDVEGMTNEGKTADADVEGEMTILQFQRKIIDVALGRVG